MTGRRVLLTAVVPALLFATACGGSSDDGLTGPDGGNQTATAVASPAGATVSRGGTTTVTVVFSATGGLNISKIVVSREYVGISIKESSTQTRGTTITRVFTIGADDSIPIGAHEVSFTPSVSGIRGYLNPQITNAIFTLTVTQ